MSEFASCYFCGTALDAQIDPYPVVPEDAGTDDRPTVDLCPVCRRKLSKVLDVALSAAEGAERTATPLAAGPEPSPLSADHEDPTADIGSDDDEGPAYAVEPSGEATAVADSEGERSEPSDESSGERSDPRDSEDERSESSESRAASEASRERADSEGERSEPATDESETDTDATDVDEANADVETAESTTVEGDASGEADDAVVNGEEPGTDGEEAESAEDGAEAASAESNTAAATDSETAGGTDTAENDESDGSDQPSILSTPAAQKVIKLLQNREFPVEREEIEVVASNAYAIPQQDCEDVLDALVSEGYVGERTGKLVRPEE